MKLLSFSHSYANWFTRLGEAASDKGKERMIWRDEFEKRLEQFDWHSRLRMRYFIFDATYSISIPTAQICVFLYIFQQTKASEYSASANDNFGIIPWFFI